MSRHIIGYSSWICFFLFFACQEKNEQKKELAELLAQQKQLKEALKTVTEQIAVLDTSKRVSLPRVRVTELIPDTFIHFIDLQGTVRSDYAIDMYPELGGPVEKIYVRDGDYVKRGTLLVKLNTDIVDKQIRELELNLDLATLNYEKQAKLYEQGVGTELEYKKIKNDKESLEQKLATTKYQRDKSLITAPFSGYIDRLHAKVGEMAGPQAPLLRLVDLQKITVEAEVSEMYLGKVKEGSNVEIYFSALDLLLENLKVSYSSKFIHSYNRTFTVQIDLDNRDKRILPNLVAKVRLEDFREKNALVVPAQAILYNNKGESYLFVVDASNKVTKRKVEVGLEYQGVQHIPKGLKAGERVVTEGFQALIEGEEVQIFN